MSSVHTAVPSPGHVLSNYLEDECLNECIHKLGPLQPIRLYLIGQEERFTEVA